MRTKTRIYWLAAVLLLFGMTASGCDTSEPAEALFAPTATPGIVHVGTPVEIPLDEPLSCLGGRSVEGEALFGIARLNDEPRPAVVNLAASQAYLADVGKVSPPPGSMRYVAHVVRGAASHVQDGIMHREPDQLLVYDLLEGTTTKVAEGGLSSYDLDISGDVVAWAQSRDSERKVFGYDLSQNRRFTIAEGDGVRIAPQISGDWVVYLFWHHEEQPVDMLRAHHIPTGEDFEIGLMPLQPGDFVPSRLAISGNRVAWIGIKRGEIHLYDLETRTDEIIFTDGRPHQVVLGGLDMEGDLLMWGGTEWGAVGYDLVYEQLFEIPDLPDDVRMSGKSMFISGNYVAWSFEAPHPMGDLLMTPPPPDGPKPTLPPGWLEEMDKCRSRLFVAPITRR